MRESIREGALEELPDPHPSDPLAFFETPERRKFGPEELQTILSASQLTEKERRVLQGRWATPKESLQAIGESLGVIKEAIRQNEKVRIGQELGDLLFSLVNLARFTQVDPEGALRETTHRFIDRFKEMDRMARAKGRSLHELSLEEMDVLWEQSKNKEKG
jgi:uncharacterized protein YabN with tetrapyrrole methylase and pyrophosphatase domain